MHPVFIRLPFLPEGFQEIYSYGLMLVLGFIAGYYLTIRLAKRCGQNPEELTNIVVLALLGGVIGARAMYVIHFWKQEYAGEGLWKAINVRDGGLEFYGGVLLAIAVVLVYLLVHKLPVRFYLDLLAPALMLGLSFGRMGCFLNGCDYGKVCNLPWAMSFPYGSYAYLDHLSQGKLTVPPELSNGLGGMIRREDLTAEQKTIAAKHRSLPVYPTQLYSLVNALVLCGILSWYFWKRRYEGQVFLLMIILYGIARFCLELLRTEPKVANTGLTISQNLSVVAVIAGLACWLWMIRQPAGQVDPKTGRVLAKTSK
ncbi:MAG: prolipoprotein diacylglyceryl transferase [Actinobacteria bacterium]|nr:prolipoprotein diacylglyceryl transferase [Actinomycetota bacterium]